MSYSPLTDKYIPANTSNYSYGRAGNRVIKITPHHMAGNLSIETCGRLWQTYGRNASSNYGIGTDGRIGCYVDEENRSWCSSSAANDNVAITIEVANDGGADTNWHVSDKAINSLINLMVDICKRYGIKKMNFTGNANGNLTLHKYFAQTVCPGPYLESKMPWIADQVNKKLNGEDKPKLTWTKLDKVTDYICKLQPTHLWDFNHKHFDSCKSIKEFKKGDQITIYGKVYNDSLKSTYLLTEYSYTNKITNGFNVVDMELKPEPKPEPTPVPHEWQDIEPTKYTTNKETYLYNIDSGAEIKKYNKGEEVEIVQTAKVGDKEYGRTLYSKEKNVSNGFLMADLDIYKPEPTPEPSPEPEPEPTPEDPTIGILQKIIAFIQHIIELIIGKEKK